MTITYPNQTVSLTLDKGALIDLRPTNNMKIEVECGNLWVTQEGDASDHVLGPGETFDVARGRLIVVQALRCSDFRVASI